jgi:hypothetical protein
MKLFKHIQGTTAAVCCYTTDITIEHHISGPANMCKHCKDLGLMKKKEKHTEST